MGAAVSLERKAIRASGIRRRRADATGRHRISSPIPSGLTRRIFIKTRFRLRLRLSEDFQRRSGLSLSLGLNLQVLPHRLNHPVGRNSPQTFKVDRVSTGSAEAGAAGDPAPQYAMP